MNPVHMDQVRILAHFSYDGAKESLVMDNTAAGRVRWKICDSYTDYNPRNKVKW